MKMRRGLAALPLRALLGATGALFLAHGAYASSAPTPCELLNGATLPLDGVASQVSILAVDIPAQSFNGLNIPTFCYVAMVVSSNANPAQSQIQMIFGLPEGGAWNGRFVGTGNGGFAGAVSLDSAALYVAQGYAAANNDLGTGNLFHCNTGFCGSAEGVAGTPNQTPGGLYGDAAAITDFGYGATHLMTIAGKQLVLAYYGQAPSYSYFHGCSTGGQQALMEAQRFPTDYNGIAAGSPAYNRTHLHIASAALYEQTHLPGTFVAGGGVVTAAGAGLAHTAMLNSCAGTDGGLASDNFLTQPNKCGFDATTLECTGAVGDVPCTDPTAASCTCLTPDAALALNADWAGARDNHNRVLFPGYERGVEDPAAASGDGLLVQEAVTEPLFDSLDYWAFGPSFTWQSLFKNTTTAQGELATKIAALDATPVGTDGATFASVLNANSGNLSAFAEAGGKLVMYAGYEDPLIPTASAIDYFNTVAKDDPQYNYYLKLFLAPGTWHCSGGPGANVFGNLSSTISPNLGNPAYDVFAAMTNWVENGLSQAPKTVIATKFTNDTVADGVAFQRPLCAYPENAAYKSGDPTQASSWKCQTGKFVTNQPFNKLYGPH
jgi:feruloyl esterase